MLVGGVVAWITSLPRYSFGAPVINGLVTSFIIYLALAIVMHKTGIKYELGTWVEKHTGF